MTLRRKAPFGVAEDRFSADRREVVLPMSKPHVHNQIEINYLHTGAVTYLYNGQTVEVTEGDLVFFWGAIPHQAIAVKPQSRFVCIYVPLEMFMFAPFSPELKTSILTGGFIKVVEKLPMDDALLRQIRLELQTSDPFLSELNYRHLELRLRRADTKGWMNMLGIASAPATSPGNTHRKVIDMTRYISEHSDSALSAAEIAGAVSLHPKYAMTLFHKSLGMTITQYVTRRRLVTAQRLLVSSDKNAAAIAYESGFGSISRFYAAFRDQIGMSPREFQDIYDQKETKP